jgi:hypothetical protein
LAKLFWKAHFSSPLSGFESPPVALHPLRQLFSFSAFPFDDEATENEQIHLRAEKTIERFFWTSATGSFPKRYFGSGSFRPGRALPLHS